MKKVGKLMCFNLKTRIIISLFIYSFNMNAQFFEYNGKKNKSFKSVKINYSVSELGNNDFLYSDVQKTKKIKPHRSAIVLIDVWEKSFLYPMIENFINPLIEEASRLGVNIIYAPSNHSQSKRLKIADNSITFYNLDAMDEFIYQNNIENLFYVGFDALLCMIDKPNGLFSFKRRNYDEKINYFVFDKGVTSFTKEMKQVALSLYKKNNIGVISTDDINYKITYPKKTVKNIKPNKKIDTGKGIVIVFRKKKLDDEQREFIESLKKTRTDYAEVLGGKLIYQNRIISTSYNFIQLLIKNKIKNIYYSGYHLNNEIMSSKFGITNLYSKKRYSKISEIPDLYIVIDQVYLNKTNQIKASIEKKVLIGHYRNLKSISSNQLLMPN